MASRTAFLIVGIAAFTALLGACSPAITTHGNMPPTHKIEQVEAQVTTRSDIVQNWGPPSTVSPFDNNTWYYIGETDSQKGIFAHDVEKRQIIRVKFDEMDKVTEVATIDPKLGKDVDLVSRKTPAAGKEYTVVQQFIGNLGRFNKSDDAKKKPGSP